MRRPDVNLEHRFTISRRTALCTGGALAVGLAGGVGWSRSAAQAAPVDGSILTNGDFEELVNDFPVSWRQYNRNQPVIRVGEPTRSGLSAVKLIDNSTGLRSDRVPIQPGSTYEATAWVIAVSGTPDIYLEFWNEANSRVLVAPVKAAPVTEWQQLAVRGTAPEDAVTATVLLYSSSINFGEAVFDDAGLRELSPAELLAVPNADFELVTGDQPTHWTQWNASVPYLSSDEFSHSGNRSTHYLTDGSGPKGGLRSSKVPVNSGTRYEAVAQTLVRQGTPMISLEYWDSNNSRLATYYSDPGRWSDEWYPLSTLATAPPGAVAATVMLYSGGAPSDFFYDDVALTEITPEEVRIHPLLLTGHPRYQLGPDDIAQLRGLDAHTEPNSIGVVGKDIHDEVISDAESYVAETEFTVNYYNGYQVTYPVPVTQPDPMAPPPGHSGKYPYWSGLGKALRDRLDTLACAYTLTERAEFADKIRSYVTTLAGWDAWADPQFGVRADQFTGYITQAVTNAYDQLHDSFTETERSEIVETLTSKGLDVIFPDALPGGGQIGGTAPTLAMGGLVLLGEDDRADRYLTRAEDIFASWLDFRMTGGRNEGFGYTAYSSEALVRSLAAIERVTGDTSLSRHPFFTDHIWRWQLYSAAPPASFAAFSDALAKGYLGATMHYLNRFLDNGYAGWLLATCEYPAQTAIDQIYWYETQPPVTEPTDLPPSIALPEVGEAYFRSGFEPSDALLVFRALDSTYGHNHNDQNSFQLAIGGAWLGRDPGYRDTGTDGPTFVFSKRDGHSTLLIDEHGQTQLGQGFLDRTFAGTGFAHARGRAAGAYRRPDLDVFDRHTMRIGRNRFVLIDRIAAPAEHRFTFQLFHGPLYQHHVEGTASGAGEALSGHAFHAHNGAGELWGYTTDGVPQTIVFDDYPGAEQYGLQLRATGQAPVTESTRITTLEAKAVADESYLLAADLHARMQSTGGEVSQNAGVTRLTQNTGDLVITINVPEAGDYRLASVFMTGASYGKIAMRVDDVPLGGAYDPAFFALVPGPVFVHGTTHLTAGDHTVTYRSTPGATGGSAFAVQSLQVIPESKADDQPDNGLSATHHAAPGIQGLCTTADRDTRTELFGTDGDVGWVTEWAVVSDGGRLRRLAEVSTDAEVAVIQAGRGRGEDALHRLGAMRMTRVEMSGIVLATASAPVDISIDASGKDIVQLEAAADDPTSLELRIGRRFQRADGGAMRTGRDGYSVVVDIEGGETTLVFRR